MTCLWRLLYAYKFDFGFIPLPFSIFYDNVTAAIRSITNLLSVRFEESRKVTTDRPARTALNTVFRPKNQERSQRQPFNISNQHFVNNRMTH